MLLIGHTVLMEDQVGKLRIAFPRAQLTEVRLSDVLEVIATTYFTALFLDRPAVEHAGWTTIARLKERFPSTVIIAYLRQANDLARLAFQLGRVQIDEICVAGAEDHPDRLRKIVRAAGIRATTREIERLMKTVPPCMAASGIELVLNHISELRHARDLAARLDISVTRLRRELKRAGLPTPRKLLSWLQAFAAARLLQEWPRSTERVGLSLGYSSGTSFYNACHNTVGATPGEIVQGGGVRFVAERFRSVIETEALRGRAG